MQGQSSSSPSDDTKPTRGEKRQDYTNTPLDVKCNGNATHLGLCLVIQAQHCLELCPLRDTRAT
jgi:hypothetical protein